MSPEQQEIMRPAFGYGSEHDGEMLDADLANEVANEVLALLQGKYPQFRIIDCFP